MLTAIGATHTDLGVTLEIPTKEPGATGWDLCGECKQAHMRKSDHKLNETNINRYGWVKDSWTSLCSSYSPNFLWV